MSNSAASRFVYVTYIRTTAQKLWEALTDPNITATYWSGVRVESTWTRGAAWQLVFANGKIGDSGEIVEALRPRRLVIRWRNEFREDLRAEGFSTCTMEIETLDGAVKLTVTHEMNRPESPFIGAVSNGWPRILSDLKSLLETGKTTLPVEIYRPE